MTASLSVSVICAIAIGTWLAVRTMRKPKLPYPPGPKGLPFIGNVLDVNLKKLETACTEWGATYGDIVYSRIFGQDTIIVNSEKTARLLADSRPTIYSDRPHSPIYRLFGMDYTTLLMKQGDELKIQRKLLHLSLRNGTVDRYQDIHLKYAHQLVENMLRDNLNLYDHIDLYIGANVVELTYGRKIERRDDPIFTLTSGLSDALSSGLAVEKAGLLMAFPILEYLPSWFPGAAFKDSARYCRDIIGKLDIPIAEAKRDMERGVLPNCIVSDVLKHEGLSDSVAKGTITGAFLTGIGPVAAALKILVLAIVLHPDVQKSIHAELDATLGKGVVPTFQDVPRLPYLQAVLYESMRWHPSTPLGMAHATTSSDIYEGYYIPKGAIVIFNTWAMKDHECAQPERFDPTRHLGPDGQLKPQAKQVYSILFGFGRRLCRINANKEPGRVCPGRIFAENLLWAAAAVMFSSLRFDKAKDSDGNDIDIEPVFPSALVSYPHPFRCSITSRFVE